MKDKKGKEGKKGRSPFQDFVYEKGFQYSSEMVTQVWVGNEFQVHEGLHAYYNIATAEDKLTWLDRMMVEMYIPIGAKYYKGIHGDIVSNHLIWY